MKKIFMLQAVLVLAIVLCRPSEAAASEAAASETAAPARIWMEEEGEPVFYEVPKETDGISLMSEEDPYSEYDFERKYSFYADDTDGTRIKLFTVAVTGTVYFYEDGKVHLLRCGANVVETIRKKYTVYFYTPTLNNTDGSYSSAEFRFYTYDPDYISGDFFMDVYFIGGSTQIYGDLKAVRLC